MNTSHASEFDAGGASFMKEALPMYEILNFVLYGLPAWLAVFLAAIGLMQKKDKQSDRAEGSYRTKNVSELGVLTQVNIPF